MPPDGRLANESEGLILEKHEKLSSVLSLDNHVSVRTIISWLFINDIKSQKVTNETSNDYSLIAMCSL